MINTPDVAPVIATPGLVISTMGGRRSRVDHVVGFNAAGEPLVFDPTTGKLRVFATKPGESADVEWGFGGGAA